MKREVRMIKIKSQYRKLLLALIGNYKELPATKNGIDILLKAYPIMQDRKKLKKTYEHLQEMKLARKVALFKVARHNKDTIEITQKGIDVLKENGIDLLKSRKVVYDRDATLRTKQFQYKIAEADIFFKGALQETNHLVYYSRDTLIEFLKRQGTWDIAAQFSGSRINGLLKSGTQIYPLYNIKDRNIKVNYFREKYFIDQFAYNLGTKIVEVYDKVLLADSIDIINKTILLDESTEKALEKSRRGKERQTIVFDCKTGLIFRPTVFTTEKFFLFLNTIEQQELVEFFKYEDEKIRNYLIEMNLDKILEGNRIHELGTSYGNISVYETDSEVGVCIVKQELNEINRLYRTLCSASDKLKIDARKMIVYGLPCNKALYDKVLADFPYTEFREINKDEFLRYLQGT